MELRRARIFHVIGVLLLFLICVHGRRKYPKKVHAMVQEQLARRRWGSELGDWSSWGSWSPCSRSCGGGVTTQTRDCLTRTNSTSSGQRRRQRRLRSSQCIGVYKRFHMCSEEACPEPAGDLREEQCSSFDGKPYRGKLYRWRPHYSSSRPCSLTCRPHNAAFYVTLRRRVQDGTRCGPDGGRDLADYVCAAGTCKHIGCDGVVGSPRVRDACGVCGGKNSTCQIISGIFTEPYLEAGYRLVVQIPAGACSIHIEELGATNNYLALRDIRKKFIINGDWSIDNSGTYSGAGASFAYKRQSGANGERITSPGPISEPVDIFILYRQANRGIKYEYAIKQNSSLTSVLPRLPTSSGVAQVPPLAETLLQSAAELSPAAELQPAGAQRPKSAAPPPPSDGRGVPGFVSSLYQRPRAVGRTGRTGPGRSRGLSRRRRRRRRHRFQWVVTGYSECSRTCGGGVQSAEVVCMRRKRKQLVRDRKCDPRRRPRPQTIACNTSPCPVSSWAPNAWSPCSTTCGAGHQTRTFLCVRAGRPVEVTDCVGRPTEAKTQPCNLGPCLSDARWQISEWSECSVSCGWGTRTRQVSCVQGGGAAGWCPEAERPRDAAPCRRQDCPEPAQNDRRPGGWMFTEWTEQCSVDCGQGVQWRGVTCGGGTDRCDAAERPLETRPCKTDRGCGGMWFSGPWSQCSRECGGGEASRTVLCVRQSADQFAVTGERACAGVPRPAERQPCAGRRRDCPPRWFVSEWAACSASCGPGSQRRTVACVDADGRRAAGCAPAAAPAEHRDCHLADCPKQGDHYHMRVEWLQSPEPRLRLLHG